MKNRLRWLLLGVLGLATTLAVLAALLLPRLVDAESYRGILRSNFERELGRSIDFGAMELSLWPMLGLRLNDVVIGRTPGERFERPLVADSLQVGARLFPLLRGRLEVTSIVVDGPVLTLYKRDDGSWEPALTHGDAAAEPPPVSPEESGLVIERLELRRARVVLRRGEAGRPLEAALNDLTLQLDGLGTRGPVSFEFLTALAPAGTLRGSGTVRTATDAADLPLQVSARVSLAEVLPATLSDWLAALGTGVNLPEDLLAESAFSAEATIGYTAGRPALLVLSEVAVRGAGVRLVRSPSGAWNYESLSGPAPPEIPAEESSGLAVHLIDLTIENASMRVEDRPTRGDPARIEFTSLRVHTRQPTPGAAVAIDVRAAGGVEGRAALKGILSYEPVTGKTHGRLLGELDVTGIDPRDLRLATALAAVPAGLVVGRPFRVSTEIEATFAESPDITLRKLTVRDLDLAVERDTTGAWSPVPASVADKSASTVKETPTAFRAEGIELIDASLRVTDRMATGKPAVLNLGALRLSLDRLPDAGPAVLELASRVGSAPGAGLMIRGKVGPFREDAAAMPLDLSVKLTEIALAELRSSLPVAANLDLSNARAAADLRLSGSFARKLDVTGDVSLSGGAVSLDSPRGDTRNLPFDLRARGQLTLLDAAARVELPKLELELPRDGANRVLTLRGWVNLASDPRRVDLELLPTRVAADDLAALAVLLAPGASLSFASPDPVALELRARGSLGGGVLPDLEGRATLSGFTFRVAGMTQPMEQVGAQVTFSPNRVALDDLRGVIGRSDVKASRVVVTNFAAPRVQVALESRNADFWELFSFIEEPRAEASPASPTELIDPFSLVTIEGTLRIDRGSLQTLTFDTLTAGMDFRGGVLTLAPLEMSLYDGRFAGKLLQDLNTGLLTVNGKGTGVDADGFLTQNLSLGGLISGRATTDLNIRVVAADPANVLSGVSGGGPLQLAEGRLAKLEVLKSLSRVTGIFGERSLQRLSRQLASAGTPFRRAETVLKFDSGKLTFEDLVIETAELTLLGRAALDSATEKLEGRFAVAFSPELSAAMRDEGSRAASLFWDPQVQRVSFGFAVGGQVSAPNVSVDWEAALRGIAERKLGERLRGLLDRRTGAGQTGTATQPPPPGPIGNGTAVDPDTAGATPGAEVPGTPSETGEDVATAPALVAEITRTQWTGPVLLRDLSLEGSVRGVGIERAALTIVDARGNEVRRIDRLRPVDDQLASGGDPGAETALPWSVTIDGKRLLAARFPVQVTVTVFDKQGRAAATTRTVERR